MKNGQGYVLFLVAVVGFYKTALACPTECTCFGFYDEWITDCSNKDLSTVPANIEEKTTELFLQGNQLTEIPNTFQDMPNLKFLYLHQNQIKTLGATAFRNMVSLKTLTLSHNKIEELSESIFQDLTSLKVLNVDNNMLVSLPPNLLMGLNDLVQASFYNNEIGEIDSGAFAGLSKLRYIGLANNQLSQAPDLEPEEYPEVFLMDVSDNQLEELPRIPSSALQFYGTGNKVKSLSAYAFSAASALEDLYLQGNEVASIASGTFDGAPKLQSINMMGNKLSAIYDDTFGHLHSLQGLDLSENPSLGYLSCGAFGEFAETLSQLSLNNCNFTYLDPCALNQLSNSNLQMSLGGNPWHCGCNMESFAGYVADATESISDIEEMLCVTPAEKEGQQVNEVEFVCEWTDDDLALIISLSIVGAVLLFGVASFMLYKSAQKSSKKSLSDSDENDHSYVAFNAAYDDGQQEASNSKNNQAYDHASNL